MWASPAQREVPDGRGNDLAAHGGGVDAAGSAKQERARCVDLFDGQANSLGGWVTPDEAWCEV